MLFANGGGAVFRRTALVQGLAGVAVALAAGAAVAEGPMWDPAAAKYDLTDPDQIPSGSNSKLVDGEITVSAKNTVATAAPYLFQDNRESGARRGLGIGPNFAQEIEGTEYLEVTATPNGSAQGVSGVWLTNLYCGNDGANVDDDCVTGEGGNQDTGEQASVEIDYLAPDGSIVCESFHALGSETLNGADDQFGDVYVDFGVPGDPRVLQMVGARFSARIPKALEGACPLKDPLTAVENTRAVSGNEFSVLGFVLDKSVDTAECTDTEGTCKAINIPGLTAVIQNPPQGTVTVANSEYVVDTRTCGSGGDLHIDVDDDGEADVIVPAKLCGIPNNATPPIRQIWIQNIASELVFNNQFVDIEVENPANPAYFCEDPNGVSPGPYNQPVQTWIPRWDDPAEIPVFFPGTSDPDKMVQDVTTACGSYRSTTRALSYLVGNLHYAENTHMVDVVSAEISRLEQTVVDSFSCINNGKAQSTLSSAVGKVRSNFDRGNYPRTLSSLNDMAVAIKGTRLAGPLQSCDFDFGSSSIVPGSDLNPSALLYSYLLVQIDHLIFQVNNKL